MDIEVKQILELDLRDAKKLLRAIGKYVLFFAILVQCFYGMEEMLAQKHTQPISDYGPVQLEVIKSPKSQEFVIERYNFNKADNFYRSLSLPFISAVDKELLHEYVLNSIPTPLRKNAAKYINDIFYFSEKQNLDPIWVMAVIWTESHFRPRASSYVSATGLMQIMPNTGTFLSRLLKRPKDKKLVMQLLVDPRSNIELGTFYLRRLLNRFKTHRYATVAYNMGPQFVSRRIRTGLPVGNRNQYYDKVKRYYRILLSGVHSLESVSSQEGKKSILKYRPKLKPLRYYLGKDIDFKSLPKYASH